MEFESHRMNGGEKNVTLGKREFDKKNFHEHNIDVLNLMPVSIPTPQSVEIF